MLLGVLAACARRIGCCHDEIRVSPSSATGVCGDICSEACGVLGDW